MARGYEPEGWNPRRAIGAKGIYSIIGAFERPAFLSCIIAEGGQALPLRAVNTPWIAERGVGFRGPLGVSKRLDLAWQGSTPLVPPLRRQLKSLPFQIIGVGGDQSAFWRAILKIARPD